MSLDTVKCPQGESPPVENCCFREKQIIDATAPREPQGRARRGSPPPGRLRALPTTGHPARLRARESAASNLQPWSRDEATRGWRSSVRLPDSAAPGASRRQALQLSRWLHRKMPFPGRRPSPPFCPEAPVLAVALGSASPACSEPAAMTHHVHCPLCVLTSHHRAPGAGPAECGAESVATRVCRVCVVRAHLSCLAYVVKPACGRAHGPSSVLGSGACLPAVWQAPRPCQGTLTAGPTHPAWSRRSLPRSWLAAGHPGPPALERPAGSSIGGHGAAGGVGLHAARPRSSALPAASLDEGLGPGGQTGPLIASAGAVQGGGQSPGRPGLRSGGHPPPPDWLPMSLRGRAAAS